MTKYAMFNSDYKFIGWDDTLRLDKVVSGEIPYYINCDAEDANYLIGMMSLQMVFQLRLGSTFTNQFIMNNVLYTEAELQEMLREIEGFKSWKHYDWSEEERAEHLANAKEEFIDALHFMLNIAIALGMSSEEIFEIYVRKNIVNHQRQDNGY